MSFYPVGLNNPPPESHESTPPSSRSAFLPGDPFPWAPDLSVSEPPSNPGEPPTEQDQLFPPDLGEGD